MDSFGVCNNRLIQHDDPRDRALYPLIEAGERSTLFCFACDAYAARYEYFDNSIEKVDFRLTLFIKRWIVEDSTIPAALAYFCDGCYKMYYTRNGTLLKPSFVSKIPQETDEDGPANLD